MQASPDSIYEYASYLDFDTLKQLCSSNKYFADLCSTDRFKTLIKQRYEETFPVISYKDEYYFYESSRNIYLNDGATKILLVLIDEENWKPHKDGKFILKMLERYRIPEYIEFSDNIITIPDDANSFHSIQINLDWYDKGIHYVYFYNNPNDAGHTSTGFDVQKYWEYYDPDVLARLNDVLEKSGLGRFMEITFGKENI